MIARWWSGLWSTGLSLKIGTWGNVLHCDDAFQESRTHWHSRWQFIDLPVIVIMRYYEHNLVVFTRMICVTSIVFTHHKYEQLFPLAVQSNSKINHCCYFSNSWIPFCCPWFFYGKQYIFKNLRKPFVLLNDEECSRYMYLILFVLFCLYFCIIMHIFDLSYFYKL